MTEAEWLRCRNPFVLLVWVRRLATGRRWRLFNAASCRRIESLLSRPFDRALLRAMEDFADTATTDPTPLAESNAEIARRVMQSMCSRRYDAIVRRPTTEYVAVAGRAKALTAVTACSRMTCETCWESLVAFRHTQLWDNRTGKIAARSARRAEREVRANIVRDIFGNPFRPVAFAPTWRTTDAVALARGIYDDRAFDRMPILADALQDAGCDNDDILGHCRDTGTPHARGCWVVDHVLGQS